jgi:hypothetical protein
VRGFFPPDDQHQAEVARRRRRRLAAITGAMLVVILGGTLLVNGGQAVVDNLSQSHTRAGAPLVWGAHWRYHFFDRLAQILAAFSAAGVVWLLSGRPRSRLASGRWRLYNAALLLFVAATLVFGMTTEPFRDPAFLGHQLRELFTHGLVTLPLALGVCLRLARRFSSPQGSETPAPVWSITLAAGASAAIAAFLLVASFLSGAQAHGQATGLAALLFPHFAEHALGYLFVPTLAGLLYLMPARGRS